MYSTCSLLRAENEDVANSLGLDAKPWPYPPLLDQESSHVQHLFPHIHGTDGYFMARWRKPSLSSDSAGASPAKSVPSTGSGF